MPRTTSSRTRSLAAVALAALALMVVPASAQAAAPAGRVTFPSDSLTVADAAQATGRRMALPKPDCAVFRTDCDEIDLVNQLDGFDLDPRVRIDLDAAPGADIDAQFSPEVLFVAPVAGGDPIGFNRFVYDSATTTLWGHPREQLRQATQYRVTYLGSGAPSLQTFTTLSASRVLDQMRQQLDDGSAFAAAGIADRAISFEQGDLSTVFPAQTVARIQRMKDIDADGPLVVEDVLNAATVAAGTYAFGSLEVPSWLDADRTIAPTATGTGAPQVTGSERVGIALIVPAGPAPADGWPVALFGPGITRSKYDLFLAADGNAGRGIATMAFDPVGHNFGPRSTTSVQTLTAPAPIEFSGFGRAVDLNGDGTFGDFEGAQAPFYPHPKAAVALRDGLRQTAADVMSIVRAIALGVDVDGDGTADLRTDRVSLYAQSLGGIYGTMVMGTDPLVEVGALNVPGGSIQDIANLSPGFRTAIRDALRDRVPGLLNGGRSMYTESLPLYLDPAVTAPAAGALPIQATFATVNWIDRPGSPETFAPLLGGKAVLYQFAFGDQTVPNPTSARLMRAGGLQERTAFYRNDLTATRGTNPHGFLLDPRIAGRQMGQLQVLEFLSSGGETMLDPDGPGPVWEVPIEALDLLEQRNFDEALYGPDEAAPAGQGAPTPAPSPTPTAPASATPSASPSASPSATPSATASVAPTAAPSPTPTPSATATTGVSAGTGLPATGSGALAVGVVGLLLAAAAGLSRRARRRP